MPTSVNRPAHQRYSTPSPAPASALAATAIAACQAMGPVGRSCAYGGREKPIAVSQPISASGAAASGSATNDVAPATTEQAMSTPAVLSLPPSAAATVPTTSSSAEPSGSAKGAASPRRFLPDVMTPPVEPRSGPNWMILTDP